MSSREGATCRLCAELAGDSESTMASLLPDGVNNLVKELSDDLAIMPSLGPLTDDHRLVVTRTHSLGLLEGLSGTSYQLVRRYLESQQDQSSPDLVLLAFEHGTRRWRPQPICSTEHSHLHFMRVDRKIAMRCVSALSGQRFKLKPSRLEEVKDLLDEEYLAMFILDARRDVVLGSSASADGAPSQYLRQLVANEIGLDNWDWKQRSDRGVPAWLSDAQWSRNLDLSIHSTAA